MPNLTHHVSLRLPPAQVCASYNAWNAPCLIGG